VFVLVGWTLWNCVMAHAVWVVWQVWLIAARRIYARSSCKLCDLELGSLRTPALPFKRLIYALGTAKRIQDVCISLRIIFSEHVPSHAKVCEHLRFPKKG
jgi:hypothetical protein